MQVFVLSLLIYGFTSVFNTGLLLKALVFYPPPPPPPPSTSQIQQCQVKQTDVIPYTDELRYQDLQKYIYDSEPFVLDKIPGSFFKPLTDNYPIRSHSPSNSSFIQIQQYTFPRKLEALDGLIYRLTKKPVIYMASFSGNYTSSYAHIDSMSSYNFYYLKKGHKEVYIVPHEYSHLLDLGNGIDNVFVSEDDQSVDKVRSWIRKIPQYHHFVLNESQVLVFNNAKCIHKFINLSAKEEIYTIRLFSADPSLTGLRNDLFNWKQAMHYANIIIAAGTVRSTNYL